MTMSREVFDQHHGEIVAAVRLILTDPKRRKRFRLVAVHDRCTGELLAEVLSTSFGPVVVYVPAVGQLGTAVTGAGGVQLHTRQYRKARSISPLTDDPKQSFPVANRNGDHYGLPAAGLLLFITAGDRPSADAPVVFRRGVSAPSNN